MPSGARPRPRQPGPAYLGTAACSTRPASRLTTWAEELERVTPDLDRLAGQLLDRWLGLVAEVDTLAERPLRLAV